MDGISFDSLTYLPDDSFVSECNDDFGGICEDIVRLASATHLVDQLEQQLDNSPPSSSYFASGRCFDKEIPSLFSEMEYLTEVSPETEMVLTPCRDVPVVVNPSEFVWKRKDQQQQKEQPDDGPGLIFGEESMLVPETVGDRSPKETPAAAAASATAPEGPRRHLATTNYRLILQNYIQKGKRKLEESSYSKMKATVVSVTAGTNNSTSLIETVTCASYVNPSPSSTATESSSSSSASSTSSSDERFPPPEPAPLPSFRCHDCNSCFLSVERLKKHTCIIAEQYQCALCRREFRKRKTLEQHIKSHDKVFSTDDDLRKW